MGGQKVRKCVVVVTLCHRLKYDPTASSGTQCAGGRTDRETAVHEYVDHTKCQGACAERERNVRKRTDDTQCERGSNDRRRAESAQPSCTSAC